METKGSEDPDAFDTAFAKFTGLCADEKKKVIEFVVLGIAVNDQRIDGFVVGNHDLVVPDQSKIPVGAPSCAYEQAGDLRQG